MDEAIFQAPHKVLSLTTVPGGWEGRVFLFSEGKQGQKVKPGAG